MAIEEGTTGFRCVQCLEVWPADQFRRRGRRRRGKGLKCQSCRALRTKARREAGTHLGYSWMAMQAVRIAPKLDIVGRLAILRIASQRKFPGVQGAAAASLREYFNTSDEFKYRKARIRRGPCFACEEKAQCVHHVISLRHGGGNDEYNLVGLCHQCHAVVHPWMEPAGKSIGLRATVDERIAQDHSLAVLTMPTAPRRRRKKKKGNVQS